MDTLSTSLLGVATLAGGIVSDLTLKGDYYSALGFLVVLVGVVFLREYFKVD